MTGNVTWRRVVSSFYNVASYSACYPIVLIALPAVKHLKRPSERRKGRVLLRSRRTLVVTCPNLSHSTAQRKISATELHNTFLFEITSWSHILYAKQRFLRCRIF